MDYRWLLALAIVGCSTSYATDPSLTLPADGGGEGGGMPVDGGAEPTGDAGSDAGMEVAADAGDAGADAGPQIPFASRLVLRLETDAPNGLSGTGAWRDLSPLAQTITIASGTATLQSSGDAGAKGMLFGPSGAIFDVADAPSLQFGATDDFILVARATEETPLEGMNGCTFHYLFAKYNADGATALSSRVCAPNTGAYLAGSLKLISVEAQVPPPASLLTSYGVISFARYMSGTKIETYAAGASLEAAVVTPVDVTSAGSPLVLGAARQNGTGGVFGSYNGKLNRFYAFRAPPGTFSKGDFDTIRAYVKSAAPLP